MAPAAGAHTDAGAVATPAGTPPAVAPARAGVTAASLEEDGTLPGRGAGTPPAPASRDPASPVDAAIAAFEQHGAVIDVGAGGRVVGIDLDGLPIGDSDLQLLEHFPDLRSLNLSHTAVTSAGLEALAPCKKLKFLYLFNTAVDDSGLVHLAPLVRLEVLCLDATHITDAGLPLLAGLTRLEKLHVHSFESITDAGLEALASHTRLFELRVGGPGLTPPGVERLQQALPDCKVEFDASATPSAE